MHSGGGGGVAGRVREMEDGRKVLQLGFGRGMRLFTCVCLLYSRLIAPPPLPTLRGQPCTARVAIVPCENDTLSIDAQYLTLFAAIRGLRVAMSKTQLTKLISLQLQRV